MSSCCLHAMLEALAPLSNSGIPLIQSRRPHFPASVAWDPLHHGLLSSRLALASRSTLYNRQDSNLDCSEAIMWEEWSLVSLLFGISMVLSIIISSAFWAGNKNQMSIKKTQACVYFIFNSYCYLNIFKVLKYVYQIKFQLWKFGSLFIEPRWIIIITCMEQLYNLLIWLNVTS